LIDKLTHITTNNLNAITEMEWDILRHNDSACTFGWTLPYPGSIPGEGHLSRNVISHPSQLSLAIPSWVGAMSTSQRAIYIALRLGSKDGYGSCVGGR